MQSKALRKRLDDRVPRWRAAPGDCGDGIGERDHAAGDADEEPERDEPGGGAEPVSVELRSEHGESGADGGRAEVVTPGFMREITDHEVPGAESNLKIRVLDEPGQGGACHEYAIITKEGPISHGCRISFQNGPIKEVGVNGVTQEALLAVVIDRLRSFQAGPFACSANAMALGHCESGLRNLQERTRERVARGVEGLNKA